MILRLKVFFQQAGGQDFYPMDQPKLGVAYIINNVAMEMPFTNVDVESLENTFSDMGFQVHVHEDCNTEVLVHPITET